MNPLLLQPEKKSRKVRNIAGCVCVEILSNISIEEAFTVKNDMKTSAWASSAAHFLMHEVPHTIN